MKPEKAASLKLKFLCVILLLAVPTLARADSGWVLKQSTLTYHVTHPLHEVAGGSHPAPGKGDSPEGGVNFSIAGRGEAVGSAATNRHPPQVHIAPGAQTTLWTGAPQRRAP